MAKDLATTESPEDRKRRARELWERTQEIKRDIVCTGIEAGETLKDIRDGKYYKEMGYGSFDEYLQEEFRWNRATGYRYIQAVEGFTDVLPPEIVARATTGDNPIPLRILAAIRFDHGKLSEGQIAHLKELEPEELKKELIRLGYDRESMGGRGASDVGRRLIERKRYRDQSRKIGRLREEKKSLEAEKVELKQVLDEARKMHQEAIEAIKDPKAKAVLLELDRLRARVHEFEEKETKREAELRFGKEVKGAALEFAGELAALCDRFFDSVRVDDLDAWIAVHDAIGTGKTGLDDLRGRMAEMISRRMATGEIGKFSIEDPRAGREMADFALKPEKRDH